MISFRGSHNVEDWYDDLDATQVSYPNVSGGYVHEGFYDAWKELKPSIMSATKTLMEQNQGIPILVTGHSLGAALAQLCAIDVANLDNQLSNSSLIYLYTYGSPRWGNNVMTDHFDNVTGYHFRLMNDKDIVPTVPYQEQGTYDLYVHTSRGIWYTSSCPLEYTQCDGSGEDESCSYIGDSLEDHVHYLAIHENCD